MYTLDISFESTIVLRPSGDARYDLRINLPASSMSWIWTPFTRIKIDHENSTHATVKLSDLTLISSGCLNNFILFRFRIMLYEVEDNVMYTSKAKDESDEMEYSIMWAPHISIHRAHVEHTAHWILLLRRFGRRFA